MASIASSHTQVASRRLFWVGPLVIVTAIIADLIIRTIAIAIFGVPETFQSFQIPMIIGSTFFFLLMALLAFLLVVRFSRQPIRFYRVLGLIALLVSLLTPVLALTGLYPVPGITLSIFWFMIAMHTITAAIAIGLLTTLTREQN